MENTSTPAYDKQKMIESTRLFLEAIGHPVDDPNTQETPERVARMNEILFAGYRKSVKDYIKLFPNPNPNSLEPVILGGMEFYSTCAHHIKDFYGKATIAYIPGSHVLGLSKFGRIMRIYAGRLQLQEQMTKQITDALFDNITDNKGVMVMIDAKHLCVSSRGVRIHDSFTRTSQIRGMFTDPILQQKVVDVHRASSKDLFAY
jgi:GTP cyclohydrolase I